MNLSLFIARRVGITPGKSFSRLIIRIGIIAIALSIAVMIIATSLVSGFKRTISEKMFDFWGHIQIQHLSTNEDFQVYPVSLNQSYYPSIEKMGRVPCKREGGLMSLLGKSDTYTQGGVRHIQAYLNKEGVIKTKTQIEGIVLRGVGKDFDWAQMKRFLIKGDSLGFDGPEASNKIVISETTAKRLEIGIGDNFLVYFVENKQQLVRKFIVGGIYKTGLEEYDRRYSLVDIRKIQELQNFRPYRFYTEIEMSTDSIIVDGKPWVNTYPQDALNMLIHAVYPTDSLGLVKMQSGRMISPTGADSNGIVLPINLANLIGAKVGSVLTLQVPDDDVFWTIKVPVVGVSGFSDKRKAYMDYRYLRRMNKELSPQVAGFDLYLDHIDDMDGMNQYIYYHLLQPYQRSQTVKDAFPQIFSWLELQDINITIILTLMIVISVINMITALLILILDRTNMIGILKALGMTNWRVRKIFLWNAAYITGFGLLGGNLLGLGFCLLQQAFGFIRLPEDLYYVPTAPVHINWLTVLFINLATMLITVIALIAPTWMITRISPVKAIRFH